MKQLLYLLILLISVTSVAQNTTLFEAGKAHYKAEKYQEAIGSWSKILDKEAHSAALYFNLANAHYKLNRVGPSIYYYEKAIQLDPNDNDIKNNLIFAQNTTIDAIEPLPKTVFSKWYYAVSGMLSFDGWAWASVLFSLGFVALFLSYYFSVSEQKKRLLFAGSLLSILLLLVALAMAFKTYSDFSKDAPAIIFAESAEVKNDPTLGSEAAFVLHEGTKVYITARDDDWVRIVLADGKDGWIPATDLKEL